MPVDFELSRLQGELQELEDEINLIEGFQSTVTGIVANILARTLDRLTQLKEHKGLKIRHHNQRIKESGVKY